MSAEEKIIFKKKLLQKCVSILNERIALCNSAMLNAQEAANNEEKSSAGDKYETSRAMSQLEKDMFAKQLVANKMDLAALLTVNCKKIYSSVDTGCIIQCDEIYFFIAAGLGKITFEDKTIFLLSPHAPIIKVLLRKKTGDFISFNKEEIKIISIY